MKKENIRRGNTQKNNKVTSNVIWNFQCLPLSFLNNLRGRSRITYGMTSLFKTAGFTLIELLVVVLIIGILVALAVPQYQKAVEESEAAQTLVLLKSMHQAYQSYYLSRGTYPTTLAALDTTISWKPTEKSWTSSPKTGEWGSNGKWSVHLYRSTGDEAMGICIGRVSGNFAGGGWCIWSHVSSARLKTDRLYCVERKQYGVVLTGTAGRYCQKLFQGTVVTGHNLNPMRIYSVNN